MKMKLFLIISIFLMASNFYSQTLFPLHVGDKWIYWEYPSYTREEIISNDTLLSNGKIYYEMKFDESNREFYRQQGDSVFVFNFSLGDEYLKFDFSAEVGDTIFVYELQGYKYWTTVLSSTGQNDYFGINRRYWEFSVDESEGLDDEYRLTVTDSLGITDRESVWYDEHLQGAVIDNKIYGNITGNISDDGVPANFKLFQNYPNPFNPNTVISYQVTVISKVQLKVYDILGREVATLVNEEKPTGKYEVIFDGSLFSSGVYFYRISTAEFTKAKQMIIMK